MSSISSLLGQFAGRLRCRHSLTSSGHSAQTARITSTLKGTSLTSKRAAALSSGMSRKSMEGSKLLERPSNIFSLARADEQYKPSSPTELVGFNKRQKPGFRSPFRLQVSKLRPRSISTHRARSKSKLKVIGTLCPVSCRIIMFGKNKPSATLPDCNMCPGLPSGCGCRERQSAKISPRMSGKRYLMINESFRDALLMILSVPVATCDMTKLQQNKDVSYSPYRYKHCT